MQGELYDYFTEQYPDLAEKVIEWMELGFYELYIKLIDGRDLIYDPEDDSFLNIGCKDVDERILNYRFRINLIRQILVNKITQTILARRVGMDGWTISRYKYGKILPNDKTISLFANALNCSPDDFYHI